jgi:hypothetical protein
MNKTCWSHYHYLLAHTHLREFKILPDLTPQIALLFLLIFLYLCWQSTDISKYHLLMYLFVILRPLGYWDCVFEFRRRHGCLSVENVVCCQADVSASG